MAYEQLTSSAFEIDRPQEFAPYFLHSAREIAFYLNLLAKRHSLMTAHVEGSDQFFLTSVVTVDEENGLLLLDPAQLPEDHRLALSARRLTVLATQDRVKMQFKLPALKEEIVGGRRAYVAPLPAKLLRLQRREFFRLEPPLSSPVLCTVRASDGGGQSRNFKLRVADISGGGVGLHGPIEAIDYFPTGTRLEDCRLDIPGELPVLVNLRIRKSVEISMNTGQHTLRVGCEYVSLPGNRLATIERYIARIERERKARESGLAQ